MTKINAKLSETHSAILNIRDTRQQLENIAKRLKQPDDKELVVKAKDISKKLTEVEDALIQTKIRSEEDPLNFPIRLNNKLAGLGSYVDSADGRPTAQAYIVFNDLQSQIDTQLEKLAKIKSEDIADFNKQYAAKNLPVIMVGK